MVVAILVMKAVEDALIEFAVFAPEVVAVGNNLALFVSGDNGLRVAVFKMLIGDDPAVPIALSLQAEGFGVVVVVDLGFAVDGDLGVAVEEVVLVDGFLEESGGRRGRGIDD